MKTIRCPWEPADDNATNPLVCLISGNTCKHLAEVHGAPLWICAKNSRRVPIAKRTITPPKPGPFKAITNRHLIYHIYPSKSNVIWQDNVRQLQQRRHVFNGRCVFAIAVDDTTESADAVQDILEWDGAEFLVVKNDARLREVKSFFPLLDKIKTVDRESAIFYAHTKGNSNQEKSALGIELWRNTGYRVLLDDMESVENGLIDHTCVGINKIIWQKGSISPYPTRLAYGNWMFAGTYFWFRADAVFSHVAWATVPNDRYGAEAWLSGMFEPRQGLSLFQPWPESQYPTPDPYAPSIYAETEKNRAC